MNPHQTMNTPRRVALFVGVDNYTDTKIAPLGGAVADARALHEFFSGRTGGFDEVHLLENPTAGEVSQTVQRLTAPNNLPPGSCFLFYFSGHGIASGSEDSPTNDFLCSDSTVGTYNDVVTSSYSLDAIASGKRHFDQILVFDACRSPIRSDRSVAGERYDSGGLRTQLKRLEEVVTCARSSDDQYRGSTFSLFSCEQGATSEEIDIPDTNGKVSRHGIFTWALLDELKAAASDCRRVELDDSLRKRIEERMKVLSGGRGNQNPGFRRPERPAERQPYLLDSAIDCSKYADWLANLESRCGLKGKTAGMIRDELSGDSGNPYHSIVIDTIRHFGDMALGSGGAAGTDELATRILAALCETPEPKPMFVYESSKRPKPEPTDNACDNQLTAFDKQTLKEFLYLCFDGWKARNEPFISRLGNRTSVSSAVSDLNVLVFGTTRQFGWGNNANAASVGSGSRKEFWRRCADPFIMLDKASADFERKTKLWRDDCPLTEELRDALRRVFEAAKLFTR